MPKIDKLNCSLMHKLNRQKNVEEMWYTEWQNYAVNDA